MSDRSAIALGIAQREGASVAILYGSHARGEADIGSDLDLYVVAKGPGRHDVVTVEGLDVDLWVENGTNLGGKLDPGLMRLVGGKLLVDRDGVGARLLERLETMLADGPEPISPQELRVNWKWCQRMLLRCSPQTKDPVLRAYRSASFLVELLVLYHQLRRRWFRGPKVALADMREMDPEIYAVYEHALVADSRSSEADSLKALVEAIWRGFEPPELPRG